MIWGRFRISIPFLIFFLAFFHLSGAYKAMAEEKTKYTIDDLMTLAVEKNPSLTVFKANLEASKGEVISARAYPNPEFEVQAGVGRPIDASESKGQYTFAIAQPLEWPNKRFYRNKAAEAAAVATGKEVDDFRLQLKAEVKKSFYQLLLNKKTLETAAENLRIVDELLKTVEVRVKAGEAPEFELVKAKVEKMRADKELKKARNMLAVSKASLNALLGGSLKEDFDIEGAFRVPQNRYSLDSLLSYAMENHPEVLRAKKDVEAKGYSLERERASVFPDVTVKGFFNKETDKDSYGVGLSLPIPFWYQRKGEIATASAEKIKAEAEVYRAKVELAKSITEEYQNYTIALDQIEVFEKGLLKEAAEALRIAELSYRQGESGILDFLDAQRVYTSTLREYYTAFFDLESSIAALERSAGNLP